MADVILFGTQDFASLAHYYLEKDSQHRVVAFSVTRAYMPESAEFEGKPVVPFEEIETKLAPSSHAFFAPMSHRQMGALRISIYEQIKAKGYPLISYVSSKATHFDNVPIGENCFILEDNTLQPFVKIGNNVVMWSGNHIGHHSTIEDHAFFTSHVVLSGHCKVKERAFFGVNATIRDALTIAEGTLVAMGSCVTRDTEAWGVYKGNPAKKGEQSSKDMNV